VALVYACGGGDSPGPWRRQVGGVETAGRAASAGDMSQALTDGKAVPASDTTSAPPPPTAPPTAVDLEVRDISAPTSSDPVDDGCGGTLSFGPGHLVDGADDSAWRMDGDGTGATLTLQMEGPRRVLSVGLVPGFDHVDCHGTDRFPLGRRITEATWEFDDGSTASQDLMDVGTMQSIPVDVTTSSVRLHIDGVTADPTQDYTAISELGVRGV
jgi:hypothetical protein